MSPHRPNVHIFAASTSADDKRSFQLRFLCNSMKKTPGWASQQAQKAALFESSFPLRCSLRSSGSERSNVQHVKHTKQRRAPQTSAFSQNSTRVLLSSFIWD